MKLKVFFKPNRAKIITFIVVFIISLLVAVGHGYVLGLGFGAMLFDYQAPEIVVIIATLIGISFIFLDYPLLFASIGFLNIFIDKILSIENVFFFLSGSLVSLFYWYLLSCITVALYNRVKKGRQ